MKPQNLFFVVFLFIGNFSFANQRLLSNQIRRGNEVHHGSKINKALALVNEDYVGFKNGNDRQVVLIRGEVSVICDSQFSPNYGGANCEEDFMFPSEYDYFVGPKILGATLLKIVAHTETGSGTRTLEVAYNSQLGQSQKTMNLWIDSFFQSPLLGVGLNFISFALFNSDGKELHRGFFEANVEIESTRYCRRKTYYSHFENDCVFPHNYCQQYFSELNDCK